MIYKLYMGGYKHINKVVVAKDMEEAISKLHKELNLGSLPCEAEEVELPDHVIVSKDMANAKAAILLTKPKPKK